VKEATLDLFEIASEGGQPVAGATREELVEPFIAATRATLGEMAEIEVVVRAVSQRALDHTLGDISAIVRLTSAIKGLLVLGFPKPTARALAERVVGVGDEIDDGLIQDCMGEIANVIAGQAKALLASTRYHFAMSIPEVVAGGSPLAANGSSGCVIVFFGSELGDFALQLILDV
jgi:chemotaxis protein CheX